MDFGHKLKSVLEIKDLRHKDFAKMLGIPPSTLEGYICSGKQPDFDLLVRIASTLNISLDYLLENDYTPLPNLVSTKELNMIAKLRTLGKTERNIIYFLVDKFYDDGAENAPKE